MDYLYSLLDTSTLMFVAIGLIAQLCDGVLGMGFGVISSTVLTLIGLPREVVSASVNGAKIITGTASGISHMAFRNLEWRTFLILALSGALGGVIGAWLITQGQARLVGPIVSGYLIFVGGYIIWKASHIETMQIDMKHTAGVGIAGGFLESVSGVWGPLVTSNLVAFGLPPRLAVGTGNVAETVVAVVVFTVLVHHLGLTQLSRYAIGLVAGALLASPFAALWTAKLPKRRLMIGVGIMVILTSVLRLIRDLGLL
ncbi:MAG: sulfite exporter TauE/SafE family protein [Steroidobacteraceae bacterium]